MLGYSVYAENLAKRITSSSFANSFGIGINSKWGLGKTSFINILKVALSRVDEEIIQISFTPWNSNTPQGLIKDFFETVQEKISPYHSTISRLMISYSNKLVSLNSNTFSQALQASVAAVSGFESIDTLYKEIDKNIRQIGRRIIVYIDDLDRSDKEEIIEVIRLIRNTANFYNTVFIVAYDRNYVEAALKAHNEHNHELFLEKIFQLELTLPSFKKDALRKKLAENLKARFPENFHSEIDEETIGSPNSIPTYLEGWLTSMRDVTRLSNALILNLSNLIGEVELGDFLRLELIRIKYPSVYEIIFTDTGRYFEGSKNSSGMFQYVSKSVNKSTFTDSEKMAYSNVSTVLELEMLSLEVCPGVPKNQVRKVVSLISEIFGFNYSYGLRTRSHLSVIYPSKFGRYFAYNLLTGNLSEIEFSRARDLNQEDFSAKIKTWVDNGLAGELSNRFELINEFDNKEDFEKIIRGIFFFANLKANGRGWWYGGIIGYDTNDLSEKMNTYENRLVRKYYGEGNDLVLRKFTTSLFENAMFPYIFEAGLIRHIRSEFSDSFPLNASELEKYVLGYLESCCRNSDQFDDNLWALFHSCTQKVCKPSGPNTYSSEQVLNDKAIEILKEFIFNKDLDGFLLSTIEMDSYRRKSFSVNMFLNAIFGSMQSFKERLLEQSEENWRYLAEFKSFFSKLEANNFSQPVPFDFKVIPIETKSTRQR